jgi:hypothetical protein
VVPRPSDVVIIIRHAMAVVLLNRNATVKIFKKYPKIYKNQSILYEFLQKSGTPYLNENLNVPVE